ncbi:MAG: hypothetical protein ABJH98_18095 [Reichenbachiella sp.]|uniref:hypothetical protein n=1 Tax=Reichenbachiella sp. TaxID=2184521 RepID=UPI003296AE16
MTKKKPEIFIVDDYPTVSIDGKKGKLVIGKAGKGKSIIGDSLDKLAKEGWDSLNNEEKKVLEDLKVGFPMYEQLIEEAIKKSSPRENS